MIRKTLSMIGWSGFLVLSIASKASATETKTKNAAPEMICAKKTTVVVVNGKEAYRIQSICIQAK
jgi:hypothetical protein